jgi:hypothetical protein
VRSRLFAVPDRLRPSFALAQPAPIQRTARRKEKK